MEDPIISKFDIVYSSSDKESVLKVANLIRSKMRGFWVCVMTGNKIDYHVEATNEWGRKISDDQKKTVKKIISKKK